MFRFLRETLGLVALLIGSLLLLTGVAAAVVLLTAWPLDRLTSLTFFQASLVALATALVLIVTFQRDLGLPWLMSALIGPIAVPLTSFTLVAVAWLVARVTPLELAEATLLTTALGLVVLYGYLISMFALPPEVVPLQGDEDFLDAVPTDNDRGVFTIIPDFRRYAPPHVPPAWGDEEGPDEPPRRRRRRKKR